MDAFGFPTDTRCLVETYAGPVATATNSTRLASWRKPRKGYTMAHMICISGGGGGGGGFSAAAGNARGGGGGGAGAGVGRMTVPLIWLPETLTINVGSGGLGGAAGTVGIDGYMSSVTCNTIGSLLIDNTIVRGSNGTANGGSAGTATAGGPGGTAGAIGGISVAGMSTMGFYTSAANMSAIGGQSGTAGGAHTGAIGAAQTIPTTSIIIGGGCGGAGVTGADFAGGSHTPVAGSWLSEQLSAAPAAGSVDGAGGVQIWRPFFSFGGQGGSSSNAGVGGHGGHGAYGAGGGGGGGGTTGGRGGNGGAGLVIVICW